MITACVIVSTIVIVVVYLYIQGKNRVMNHPLGKYCINLGIPLDELIEYEEIRLDVERQLKEGIEVPHFKKWPKNMNHYRAYTKCLCEETIREEEEMIKQKLGIDIKLYRD